MSKKLKFKVGDKVILDLGSCRESQFIKDSDMGVVERYCLEFQGNVIVKWGDGYKGSYRPDYLLKIQVPKELKPKCKYGRLMR